MKTIIKIFLLFVISLQMNCQILPLNTLEISYANGTYLKDIDNKLPFFEGTWKGVANNIEYTFEFVLFPHHLISYPSGSYYYKDCLMGKFKVVDLTTGSTLYDDLDITEFQTYKISLQTYGNNIGYAFNYKDTSGNCYNSIDFIFLKSITNVFQVTYTAFEYYDYNNYNCPYADQTSIPMFLPTTNLVLTKQ